MNRSRWTIAGLCVAANLLVIWTLVWLTAQLNPDRYPGELAYKPVVNLPPPVDLRAVQRDWPEGLDEPGQRNRLIAYRHDRELQAPVPSAKASTTQAPPAPLDLGALLAGADANAGKAKTQVCAACHDFTPGGPDRIGPNLWGVIGRNVASRPGFAYSPAMAAQPGAWTFDRLFTYLESPARAVPGNKMGFAGFGRADDRAAVIRYLATLSTNPPPLPQPASQGGKAK